MRRRDKDKEKNGGFLLLPSKNAGDELDATPIEYDKAIYRINGLVAPERRSRVDEFLNSENEKSEYDWFDFTPTGRPSVPASKTTSISATPTRPPSSSSTATLSAPSGRSSSVSKSTVFLHTLKGVKLKTMIMEVRKETPLLHSSKAGDR